MLPLDALQGLLGKLGGPSEVFPRTADVESAMQSISWSETAQFVLCQQQAASQLGSV